MKGKALLVVDLEKFVRAWQSLQSPIAVARYLGLEQRKVNKIAYALRKKGVPLKPMTTRNRYTVDVISRLKQVAIETLEKKKR